MNRFLERFVSRTVFNSDRLCPQGRKPVSGRRSALMLKAVAIGKSITMTTTIETIMKFKLFFLLISGALLATVSGCTIEGPGLRIRPPIHVEGGGPGPMHCPPGQAKKGRC